MVMYRYPVSGHGDFGHPATGHLTSDIWTLDTGMQDIYCQNGLWTSTTKFNFFAIKRITVLFRNYLASTSHNCYSVYQCSTSLSQLSIKQQ